MLDYKGIGRRIAFYRKKINMTQAVLSEKLDISESYISQVERGNAKASLARLDEIADILGTDISCLISDKIVYNGIPVNREVFELIREWDDRKIEFLINMLICVNKQFGDHL